MIKFGFLLLGIVVASTAVHAMQVSLDDRRGSSIASPSLFYLPDGEVLKRVSFGYEQIVADVIWIRLIQVFGNRVVEDVEYDWIFRALDTVTTLDPQFVEAYEAGGLVLTVMADHVDQSNFILEKGIRADLREWKIPFLLGFNYFNFLQNYQKAAQYLELATEYPGHPKWLPLLVAKLHVQAHAPDVALEFLVRVYENTHDAGLRQQLDIRMKEVLVERDLILLEQTISRYRNRFREFPDTLGGLVEKGLISKVPLDPFGGGYEFDSVSGAVMSTTRPDRMQVYHPD